MKKILAIVALTAVLFTAACGAAGEPSPHADAGSTDIQITVAEQIVPPDADSVLLTISNISSKEYVYGAMSELEREKDGQWYTVPPKEELFWIEIAYILGPGDSNEETVTLKDHYGTLEAGQYRIVKTFTESDTGNSITAFGLFSVE